MQRSLRNLIHATLVALPLALPGAALAQSATSTRTSKSSSPPPSSGSGSSVQDFGGGAVGTSNSGAGSKGVPGAPGVEDRAAGNPAKTTPTNPRARSRQPKPPAPEKAGALPPNPVPRTQEK